MKKYLSSPITLMFLFFLGFSLHGLYSACGNAPTQAEVQAKDSALFFEKADTTPAVTKLLIADSGGTLSLVEQKPINKLYVPIKKKSQVKRTYWYDLKDTDTGTLYNLSFDTVGDTLVLGSTGSIHYNKIYNDTTIQEYEAWFLVTDTSNDKFYSVRDERGNEIYYPVAIKGFVKKISTGFHLWSEYLDERKKLLDKKYVVWSVSSTEPPRWRSALY